MAPWTSVGITLMRPIDTKLADTPFSQLLGRAERWRKQTRYPPAQALTRARCVRYRFGPIGDTREEHAKDRSAGDSRDAGRLRRRRTARRCNAGCRDHAGAGFAGAGFAGARPRPLDADADLRL